MNILSVEIDTEKRGKYLSTGITMPLFSFYKEVIL